MRVYGFWFRLEGWSGEVLHPHHLNEGQVGSAAAVSAASPPGIGFESQVQRKGCLGLRARLEGLGFRVEGGTLEDFCRQKAISFCMHKGVEVPCSCTPWPS